MHYDAESYRRFYASKSQAQLSRAMEAELVESVEKILAKGKVELSSKHWNALYALSVIANPHRFQRHPPAEVATTAILTALLKAGATDCTGNHDDSAMSNFVKMGSMVLVRIMLEHGIKPTSTNLALACRLKDKEMFDLLIEHGTPVNEWATDGCFRYLPIDCLFKYQYTGRWCLNHDESIPTWYSSIDTRTVLRMNTLIASTYRKRAAYKKQVAQMLVHEYSNYINRSADMLDVLVSMGAKITTQHVIDADKNQCAFLVVRAFQIAGASLFEQQVTVEGHEPCRLIDFLKQSNLWDEIHELFIALKNL